MASIHKQPNRPHWFASFTDHAGKRHFKSTRTVNKAEARKIATTWEKASQLARSATLSPDRARALINDTIRDITEGSGSGLPPKALEQMLLDAAALVRQGQLTKERIRPALESAVREIAKSAGQPLPSEKIRVWCDRWLNDKSVEASSATHTRYELVIRDFVNWLGDAADKDLSTLSVDIFSQYRTHCTKRLSIGTTNTHLKILRACFNAAYRLSLIERNHAAMVDTLTVTEESQRRNLTLDEIREVLKVCSDTPWRGLVLVGLYTGQRLGDCARLTWQQVDLVKKEIWFKTQKTGKRLSMSMATPLADYLTSLPSSDKPSDPVFPHFAEMASETTSSLSLAFGLEILIPAKLMLPREAKHISTGKGRTGKRQVNPVTFHSLRHSFVTMLKATGASNAMAQAIVGHDSAAINAHYSHLAAGDTVQAIANLPDITKEAATQTEEEK